MRSTADRIRQAVAFEVLGLVIVTPLGAWVFGESVDDIGVLAVIGATLAMGWNYVYNLVFDRALVRLRGRAEKTLILRIGHAVGFEAGLLMALAPIIAWWLDVSLLTAFAMNVSFSAFYTVYAFVFTWCYEAVFPVTGARGRT